MSQLNDTVLLVVKTFIKNGDLFTALDVSGAVKYILPFARHREVRNLIRSLFTSEIETAGYARTPISVTLVDGTITEALLYHPLADSWDLDSKYDAQKRTRFISTLPTTTTIPPTVPVLTSLSNKDKWNNLLQSQPSLFQTK